MIGSVGDDDAGSLLGGGLIGERERWVSAPALLAARQAWDAKWGSHHVRGNRAVAAGD